MLISKICNLISDRCIACNCRYLRLCCRYLWLHYLQIFANANVDWMLKRLAIICTFSLDSNVRFSVYIASIWSRSSYVATSNIRIFCFVVAVSTSTTSSGELATACTNRTRRHSQWSDHVVSVSPLWTVLDVSRLSHSPASSTIAHRVAQLKPLHWPLWVKTTPNISQESVASLLRCGRLFNDSFITNLLRGLTVKEFRKSLSI